MNNIFSVDRLFKTIKSDIIKYLPSIYIIIAVLASIPIIAVAFRYLFDTGNIGISFREVMMYVATTFLVFSAPFIVYKNVNHKKNGVEYTMLPCSVLEKYISMVFIIIILIPSIFIISYLAIDSLIALLFSSFYKGYLISYLLEDLSSFGSYVWRGLLYASVGIAGNLIFRTHKVGKTLGYTILTTIVLTSTFAYASFNYIKKMEIEDKDGKVLTLEEFASDLKSDSINLDSTNIAENKAYNSDDDDNIIIKKNGKVYGISNKSFSVGLKEYLEDYLKWVNILISILLYVIIPGGLYGISYYKLRYQQL